MKKRLLQAAVLFGATLFCCEAKSQNLVVRLRTGTEYSKGLSTVQKLTFSNGTVLVHLKSNPTETYPMSTVQKIYFQNVKTDLDNVFSSTSERLNIYPNPVDNVLFIQNAPTSATALKIYRLDGALLLNETVSNDTPSVNVSNLPSGMYLIKMNNQVSKFVKQ